jgi:hypothetical protein
MPTLDRASRQQTVLGLRQALDLSGSPTGLGDEVALCAAAFSLKHEVEFRARQSDIKLPSIPYPVADPRASLAVLVMLKRAVELLLPS